MHICIYKYICRDGSGSAGVLHICMLRHNFHTASRCIKLHHTVTHCYTLKHPSTATIDASRSAGELCTELKTLQHTATLCNALQILHHTASHCNTLQHCNTATGAIMEWQWLVYSFKIYVSFAEYGLFYKALLQKRPMFLRSLLIGVTSCRCMEYCSRLIKNILLFCRI